MTRPLQWSQHSARQRKIAQDSASLRKVRQASTIQQVHVFADISRAEVTVADKPTHMAKLMADKQDGGSCDLQGK